MKNNIIIGSLCALGCETFYGLSYIFTKQATVGVSALTLLGWRFLTAFIGMSGLALTGVVKINLKGKNLKPLFTVAIFCPVIYFICETFGINLTTASESGVFLACIPVASLVASSVILKKKPSKMQVAGILLTLVGVILTVFALGVTSSISVIGYLCLIVAVISYALYSVFVEKANDFSSTEITYMMIVCGAIVFVVAAFCESVFVGNTRQLVLLPFNNVSFLIAILYQGLGCSIGAFFLNNVAISKIGVNKTSSFIGIATVVSIVAGAVILKESFTLWQIVGAVVIILGVYVSNVEDILRK